MRLPHKDDLRLLRSRLKGISCLTERAGTIQRGSQSSGSPLTSRTIRGPVLIHEDFSGSLQGVHIQDASSPDDFDGGAEPNSFGGGQWR